MLRRIHIAKHSGFCMGVKRAIQIAEETAAKADGPVTILNEIVHNEAVVEKFRKEGVGQVGSVHDVTTGTLIISAHGVAPDIKRQAEEAGLTVVDATCPLVERIYKIIEKVIADGYHVIHIGDPNHDETHGIVGHAPDQITVVAHTKELADLPEWKDRKLGLTVQTTAHTGELAEIEKLARQKWPQIEIFNTICNATTQRQTAVMDLAPDVDLILIVGSSTSANSNRLARIANVSCGRGYLIGSATDIRGEWFEGSDGAKVVGVSAGASTPEFLVEEVITRLIDISGGKATVIRPKPDL
ncbi:MAG: 4-hydroxy-3-methylbut-2-enyl diphosphate reductase [candidate division Zixibacteria bacterium]|nr:4-hydroxy-3-methylbut-2-enyl diphosphate reductase [candidate division Zixibacteria bacterium]